MARYRLSENVDSCLLKGTVRHFVLFAAAQRTPVALKSVIVGYVSFCCVGGCSVLIPLSTFGSRPSGTVGRSAVLTDNWLCSSSLENYWFLLRFSSRPKHRRDVARVCAMLPKSPVLSAGPYRNVWRLTRLSVSSRPPEIQQLFPAGHEATLAAGQRVESDWQEGSNRCICTGQAEPGSMTEKRMSRWYFGGLASCGAACCTHPLDLLKVSGVRGTVTFRRVCRPWHMGTAVPRGSTGEHDILVIRE